MSNISLEIQTKNILDDILKKNQKLESLNKLLCEYKTKLNKLEKQEENYDKKNNFTDELLINNNKIKIKNELKDKIKNLSDEIDKINNNENEINFFNSDGDFIQKYYQECNDPIIFSHAKENALQKNNFDRNNIYKFFKVKNTQGNDIILNNSQIKQSIEDQYNLYLNNQQNTEQIISKCLNCGNEVIIDYTDDNLVCSVCGKVNKIEISVMDQQAQEKNTEKTIYPYKRLNHFIEWLNQFQGKESTNIPQNIYNQIINELKKIGIADVSIVTLDIIKNILKKLKLKDYYEHASFITSQISGNHPPTLDHATEEFLKQVFKKIEVSFNKHCPKNRNNFLSYPYVFHKIFQIYGNNEVLQYFPLLKSREKLKIQDSIWKNICADLNWQFYPSI